MRTYGRLIIVSRLYEGCEVDIREHNRLAGDRQVENGNQWTVPVGPEAIVAARKGQWTILLTPTKPVPRDWLPNLIGQQVLCLASGASSGGGWSACDSPRQLA